MDAALLRGTDLAIWAGVRSGQSPCRVWLFLGWQLPCPAFVQTVVCRQSLPLSPPKSHASLWLPCSLSPALPPTVAATRAGCWAAPAATTAAGRPQLQGGGRILQAMSDLQNCLWDRGCGLRWGGSGGMEITTPGMLSGLQQRNPRQPSPRLSCSITRQAVIFG